MPGPGRPRLGTEKLSDADRKARWDERIRNADGKVPGEPARKPVVIYLCEEARQALRVARSDAKHVGKGAVRDSLLVEDLLLRPGRRTAREKRDAQLIEELRNALEFRQAETFRLAAALKARGLSARSNKRLTMQIVEQLRAPISGQAVAEECKRRNASASEGALEQLARGLLPLLQRPATADYHGKMRRRIEAYIECLFGLN